MENRSMRQRNKHISQKESTQTSKDTKKNKKTYKGRDKNRWTGRLITSDNCFEKTRKPSAVFMAWTSKPTSSEKKSEDSNLFLLQLLQFIAVNKLHPISREATGWLITCIPIICIYIISYIIYIILHVYQLLGSGLEINILVSNIRTQKLTKYK